MTVVQRYLVINSKGDMRVTQRRPDLKVDEIAVPLKVIIPAAWGSFSPGVDIQMPDPPELETGPEEAVIYGADSINGPNI